MEAKKFLILKQELKAFEEPDTSSSSIGILKTGAYYVEKVLGDHPNPETDYVQIRVPTYEQGLAWICYRWRETYYAELNDEANVTFDSPEPTVERDFSKDPMAVPESALLDLLPKFAPFTYDLHNAYYPYSINGFAAPQGPPSTNNCCTFVEAIVVKAWQDANGIEWDQQDHESMMISSTEDYFSPITRLIQKGIALRVLNPNQDPHRWTVIQAWRKQWGGGHTFIIIDYHKESDRILTLESNEAFKLNGVGFRMLGNYSEVGMPRPGWWENEELWTWDQIKETYLFRKQCILKVKDPVWSKGLTLTA